MLQAGAADCPLPSHQVPVIFRQAPGELALVRDLCQLSEREITYTDERMRVGWGATSDC